MRMVCFQIFVTLSLGFWQIVWYNWRLMCVDLQICISFENYNMTIVHSIKIPLINFDLVKFRKLTPTLWLIPAAPKQRDDIFMWFHNQMFLIYHIGLSRLAIELQNLLLSIVVGINYVNFTIRISQKDFLSSAYVLSINYVFYFQREVVFYWGVAKEEEFYKLLENNKEMTC